MQALQCVESAQWPVNTLSNPATAAGAKVQGRPDKRGHRCWAGGAARPWVTPQLWSSGRTQGLCASRVETFSTEGSMPQVPMSPALQQAPRQLGPAAPIARPVKPTWVSAPLIMRKIKDTDSMQAIRQVLDEHQQQFNHIHISATVLQFAKLATGTLTNTHTRRSTSPSPTPTRPSPGSPQDSSHAVARQQSGALASPVAERREASTTPDAPSPPPTDLLRQLLSMVVSDLDLFDLRGISNTIYSLALLKHNDRILVESLLRAAQYRLDTGTPQNLSNIIWATVTLGFTPEREWMALYYNAIDAQIAQFQPQDIANMLWAFGRLQFAGTQYKVAPDIVRQLLQQAYPQLADFSPQELSNSVWGLARLGFAPNPAWCQAFLTVSQYRLPSMHPQELVSLIWGVSRLRMRPTDTWLHAAIQATQPWLTTLTTHQLSQLMVSLGSLGARPPPAWLSKGLSCALSKVRYHTPVSLSTLITGVAMLGGPAQAGLSMAQAQSWLDHHLSLAWEMMGPCPPPSTTPSTHTDTDSVGSSDSSVLDNLNPQLHLAGIPDLQETEHGPQYANGASVSGLSFTQQEDAVVVQDQGVTQPADRVLMPPPELRTASTSTKQHSDAAQQQGGVQRVLQPSQLATVLGQGQAEVQAASVQADARQGNGVVAVHMGDDLQRSVGQGQTTDEDQPPQESSTAVGGSDMWCRFSGKELGHLLYALVTLRTKLQPSQLQHMCGVLERSPGLLESIGSKGKTTGLILWSVVQLMRLASDKNSGSGGADDGGVVIQQAELQQEVPRQRQRWMPMPVLPNSLMTRLAAVTRLRMQRRYSAAELALLLRVFAAQPSPPPGQWMVAFWWRSMVLMGRQQVQPAVLASQLASLVSLRCAPHATWWRGALQCAQAGFGEFQAAHFGAVLKSMAQLGYVPNVAWSRQCLLAMYRVWEEMRPEHWEQTLWALAKMKVHVPSPWMLRYYHTSYTHLNQYSSRQLVAVGQAVTQLGTPVPAAWSWAYQRNTAGRLAQLSPTDLVLCVYFVARCPQRPMRRWVSCAVAAVRAAADAKRLSRVQQQLLAEALQQVMVRYQACVAAEVAAAQAAEVAAAQAAEVAAAQAAEMAAQAQAAEMAAQAQAAADINQVESAQAHPGTDADSDADADADVLAGEAWPYVGELDVSGTNIPLYGNDDVANASISNSGDAVVSAATPAATADVFGSSDASRLPGDESIDAVGCGGESVSPGNDNQDPSVPAPIEHQATTSAATNGVQPAAADVDFEDSAVPHPSVSKHAAAAHTPVHTNSCTDRNGSATTTTTTTTTSNGNGSTSTLTPTPSSTNTFTPEVGRNGDAHQRVVVTAMQSTDDMPAVDTPAEVQAVSASSVRPDLPTAQDRTLSAANSSSSSSSGGSSLATAGSASNGASATATRQRAVVTMAVSFTGSSVDSSNKPGQMSGSTRRVGRSGL